MEFLDTYRKAINETSPITSSELERQMQVEEVLNLGLGLEVAECQFGTEFRTGLSFGVETANRQDLTDEEENQIVESLKQAIDNFYTPTKEVCNPEFRDIQIAELGPTRSTRCRQVRQVTLAPIQPRPSTPAPAPSGSRALPVTVNTTGSNVVELSIYIAGVCNGCKIKSHVVTKPLAVALYKMLRNGSVACNRRLHRIVFAPLDLRYPYPQQSQNSGLVFRKI